MANLWILNQFKGNKSCTTDASIIKLNEHCRVVTLQNCWKLHEIPFTGYLVMTQFLVLNKQFKGKNLVHTGALLTKCKMHQCIIIVIGY